MDQCQRTTRTGQGQNRISLFLSHLVLAQWWCSVRVQRKQLAVAEAQHSRASEPHFKPQRALQLSFFYFYSILRPSASILL
jgi:hypothetical protein